MDPELPPRRVSLRDMAKMMGVSHVTISLALRDSPQVSLKTKEEVKRLAEKLGYRPDPMLNALSNYRQSKGKPAFQGVIGWINAWENPGELRGYEEFDSYWTGADRAAQKLGYQLEEFKPGRDLSPRRLDQILSSRGINGLLLPPHRAHPDWEDFPWEKYFTVKFGRSLQQPKTHLVTADQALNTVLAFEKIRELGYQRIGFITKEPYLRVHGHLFEAGFLIAQQMVPVKQRLPVLSLAGTEPAEVESRFSAWLGKNRPDAIFTDVRWIRTLLDKAGLRVPEDIAIAATTLMDIDVDSGIDQHPEEIGRVGMLLLNSIINDGAVDVPPIFRQILVEGSWVGGASMPSKSAV